jgi:hypothetical protein
MNRKRKRHRRALLSTVIMVVGVCNCSLAAQSDGCHIDGGPLDPGQWAMQAKCLLRPIEMYRRLGPSLQVLPAPLDGLIGQTNVVDKSELARYLREHGIDETSTGGPIDGSIVKARYFIIHDTSSPNFKREDFPYDLIDSNEWNASQLRSLLPGMRTHVWVGRTGESATSRDYGLTTLRAGVKLENKYPSLRGLLLHTELVQPRRCDPGKRQCCWTGTAGKEICNDAVAPEPGFTTAQIDRLALLYVAASTRRGRWLIPAFHGVVDDAFGQNAHDDPQHFDLTLWASRLQALLNDLNSRLSARLVASGLAETASRISKSSENFLPDSSESRGRACSSPTERVRLICW